MRTFLLLVPFLGKPKHIKNFNLKIDSKLLCNFSAICQANPPSFSWLENRASEAGVPILQVTFPDANDVDFIHLKQFNPIPIQPHERAEDVDPCIFEGHLENEPDVYAVLTSGCPYENSFQV